MAVFDGCKRNVISKLTNRPNRLIKNMSKLLLTRRIVELSMQHIEYLVIAVLVGLVVNRTLYDSVG